MNHSNKDTRYSLLTVAPKERGDSGSRNQAVEVQPGSLPGSGEPAIETTAVPALGSKNSNEKPYYAFLNGRAELMEILGGIFDTQSAPGFYLWFWPFKHLIAHGDKLRARLSEEESKFGDVDQESRSEATPQGEEKNDFTLIEPKFKKMGGEDVIQNEDLRPKVEEASTVSQAHADPVKHSKSEHKNLERMASQEAMQAGRDAAEFEEKAVDEIKAESSRSDGKTEGTKADNSSQMLKPDTQTVNNTRLRDELRCLITFMDSDLKDVFSVQNTIDNGTRKLIAFDHLWQLYKPGHVVISGKGQKRAYVVLHVTGGRTLPRSSQRVMDTDDVDEGHAASRRKEREAYDAKYAKASPFVIDCFYLDFDGTNFGPLPQKFMLQDYEGEVAITSLEVFPIRFDEDPKKTEKSLVRRGRKFVKLASVDHKYYSGRTLGESELLEIPGEVSSPGIYISRDDS